MENRKNSSEFIDIRGILRRYLRNWYWFVLSVFICGIGAYVYVKTHPRQHAIKSSILVTQDEGTVSMLNGLGGLLGADPYVQDEIFVITSHTVLKTVAKDLGINKLHVVKTGFLSKKLEYPTYPVDVCADQQIIDTLSAVLTFKVDIAKGAGKADIEVKANNKKIAEVENVKLPATVKTDYGQFVVTKTDTYPGKDELTTWVSVTGYDSAGEDLNENLLATIASKKSNVIELDILSVNSDYGCDILNKIMDVYNQRGIEERNQRALKTADFISERLELIANALENAESDIEHYKEGNRLVDVRTEATINTEIKTEAEKKLVELQTQREILAMTYDFITKPGHKYDLLPVTSNELGLGGTSIDAYNDLVLQRMTLMTGAKTNNKLVQELEKQIDAMRESISIAVERAIKGSDVAIKEVQGQVNLAMSKLNNVPAQEREYRTLLRQQEVKQQLYLFLLQRSEETAMLIANAIPKGTVIDEAYVLREPVGPGKVVVLIIAILIGLFIPVIVLYLRDMLRTKMSGRSDVEKITGLPVLGEMCIDRSGQNLVVNTDSTSSSAELFRMLRTNLQFVLANPGDKVVMITSSMSGEGKSFISTNLAATLAMLGKKVVLVGMDIRKPQLANYLGIPATPGLTQYLSNSQTRLSDILRRYDEVDNMSIIVAGPIPPNPGELMTSPRIAELIADLRREFDYIILDTAPVGMVSDTFNLTKFTDATIYIVRDTVTRLQDLRFLKTAVEEKRLNRVNVVINGTSTSKGYGYGYK